MVGYKNFLRDFEDFWGTFLIIVVWHNESVDCTFLQKMFGSSDREKMVGGMDSIIT